jgi:DNA-binding NarL/FixJ family response regulator
MKRPRILLASTRASSLAALRKSLEQEFDVVGMAFDYRNLLAKALKSEPDAILGDLELPLWTEPNLKRKLKQIIPETKVLLVSIDNETDIAPNPFQQHLYGFTVKGTSSDKLIGSVREFLKEQPCKAKEPLHSPTHAFESDNDIASRELTQRQREVLKLLAEGRTMRQAGEILKLTARTVAFHKYKIMRDFELHNNLELLRLAIRKHLVSAD